MLNGRRPPCSVAYGSNVGALSDLLGRPSIIRLTVYIFGQDS